MQLETLRNFVLLSESLSFSATAKQLYVSQSVLSKRISSLEQELETVLFVRDKHSVRLTAEGRLFAKRTKKTLESYDESIRELERMKRCINSLLKVGYIHGACHDFIPKACYDFSKRNLSTELELYSMEADQIVRMLLQNEIDIGLTTYFKNSTPDTLEHYTLFKDSFGILVPPNHRLARYSVVLPEDLKNETLLTPNAKTFPFYSRFVRNALRDSDYQLETADEMFDISMVLPFLATERGIALTMCHLSSYYGSNFRFIPLNDPNFVISIVIMWKKAHEKDVMRDFIDCVKQAAVEPKLA